LTLFSVNFDGGGWCRNYVTQDVLRRIMTDYFGYDVQLVMNVTDIDDKVMQTAFFPSRHVLKASNKIIERARQNHLLANFRSQTTSLTSALLAQVRQSWNTYVRTQVNKGVPENDRATEENEEVAWLRISELYSNPEWKQECLKRDEKFDMHYSSAVRPNKMPEIAFLIYSKI
jgi:cysteinyl-tRNA synthetase